MKNYKNETYDRFIRQGLNAGFTDDQINFLERWLFDSLPDQEPKDCRFGCEHPFYGKNNTCPIHNSEPKDQPKLPERLEEIMCSELLQGDQRTVKYLTSIGAKDIINKINQILDYLKNNSN